MAKRFVQRANIAFKNHAVKTKKILSDIFTISLANAIFFLLKTLTIGIYAPFSAILSTEQPTTPSGTNFVPAPPPPAHEQNITIFKDLVFWI